MTDNNFIVFGHGEFPGINGVKDPVIFYVASCGYILNGKQERLKSLLKDYTKIDEKTKKLSFLSEKEEEFSEALMADKPLTGLKAGAFGINANKYLRTIEKLGARAKNLDYADKDAIPEDKFDITFSTGYFDTEVLGNKKKALEQYVFVSNMTKYGGFSVHSNGNYISTLYNLFFQVLGLDIDAYIRNSGNEKDFTIILKKINDKKITKEELGYIYEELKHRNPIRYL